MWLRQLGHRGLVSWLRRQPVGGGGDCGRWGVGPGDVMADGNAGADAGAGRARGCSRAWQSRMLEKVTK